MSNIERKVTKTGNSYGITIPAEFLKESGLSYGDDVQLNLKDGEIVMRKKEEVSLPEGVNKEFMDILNDVIKEHEVAFKGLVER